MTTHLKIIVRELTITARGTVFLFFFQICRPVSRCFYFGMCTFNSVFAQRLHNNTKIAHFNVTGNVDRTDTMSEEDTMGRAAEETMKTGVFICIRELTWQSSLLYLVLHSWEQNCSTLSR